MESIEVTNSTFYAIFYSKHFTTTDRQEHANKHYYYNPEHDQRGVIVHNFIGDTRQYYLTDINA